MGSMRGWLRVEPVTGRRMRLSSQSRRPKPHTEWRASASAKATADKKARTGDARWRRIRAAIEGKLQTKPARGRSCGRNRPCGSRARRACRPGRGRHPQERRRALQTNNSGIRGQGSGRDQGAGIRKGSGTRARWPRSSQKWIRNVECVLYNHHGDVQWLIPDCWEDLSGTSC
jgi:plasmid stabilization system protein ParE